MRATIDRKQSWEKQTFWKLENGWTAIVNFGVYGENISQLIDNTTGFRWQACNGREDLPEFARAWVTPIAEGHWQTLVRPIFERHYPT